MTLLRERIGTLERLDVLLLLRRDHEHAWTGEDVARTLSLTLPVAADALDYLCRRSLVDVKVGGEALLFRYDPWTPELERAVAELEGVYAARRLEVLRLLAERSG